MHKVAIVGRPNVGKSSLFNRLIGRREAVVADLPGVTRDAKEGLMLHQNHRITLIDTGGLWSGDEWEDAIREKAEWAMEGAQAVIFVLDPREGLSAADYEVTDWLRRLGKPVIIAANKIDSPKHEVYMAELWGLGFGEPIAISAEHARGLDDLLDPDVPGIGDRPLALAAKLGVTLATSAEVVTASRGLKLRAEVNVSESITLASGETELVFGEKHTGADGSALKVPSAFLIAPQTIRAL